MSEAANLLKSFRMKRGGLKTQLKLFEKAVNAYDHDNTSISNEIVKNLQLRLQRIEPVLDTFNGIQNEIEMLVEDESEVEEREKFQDFYFSLISKASAIISSTQVNNDQLSVHSASQNHAKPFIKLPTINLPTFEGSFTTWRSFRDSFITLIHLNEELNGVQKLAYLKSALKGEPHTLITTLDTTELNYDIAWKLLNKRYDNKRRIINNHVQNILNISPITKEAPIQLRQLINVLQTQINCLKSLKQPVQSWDAILVPITVSKLDSMTVKEWETKLNIDSNKDEIPALDDLLEFLSNKVSTLEIIAPVKPTQIRSFIRPYKPQHQNAHIVQTNICYINAMDF